MDPYKSHLVDTYVLVSDPSTFLEDCEKFITGGLDVKFSNPVFYHVLNPMLLSWGAYKEGDFKSALDWCKCIEATDWRLACQMWLKRRQK
jgi:hypothetical protein